MGQKEAFFLFLPTHRQTHRHSRQLIIIDLLAERVERRPTDNNSDTNTTSDGDNCTASLKHKTYAHVIHVIISGVDPNLF